MGVCVSFLIAVDICCRYIHPLQLFKDFLVGVCVCVGVYVCVDAFLTYRATQTPLPLSKRLNCVLISCCEFPSRNPTSPLDCRAADRFPLLLFLLLRALYVTFPALSSRFFYASVDVHGTATQVRTTSERERELGSAGGRWPGIGETTRRGCLSLLGTGGLDGGFVYSPDFGSWGG